MLLGFALRVILSCLILSYEDCLCLTNEKFYLKLDANVV